MTDSSRVSSGRLGPLCLAALGVVFGDIATSPLYAVRECFHGDFGIAITSANVFGVLSLMFWSLIMIVSFKYLLFVFRADNNGEGGVIALTALLRDKSVPERVRSTGLLAMGLFAACLLYGDGMITPSISVLSAVEGMGLIAPALSPYVIPITLCILIGLFVVQRHGTARVGAMFGPVILVWLLLLGGLGVNQILRDPAILQALMPWHGILFLARNGGHGLLVLGAVFLVVTGAEALYADMGHFGKKPIRLVWFALVLPALLLNYFGQGALLLEHPELSHHPFYAMVPDWAVIPTVLLATGATIIASQAVITGSFSLTRQAIELGYLPRLRVAHTSAEHMGQIYIAPVNWLLMICTVGLVLGFQSSSRLAAAYGVAVTSTMLITTILFYFVARYRWQWSKLTSGTLCLVFLVVDFPFFGANISKITHGAWFPLVIGGLFFVLMDTWKKGRKLLGGQLSRLTSDVADFQRRIEAEQPQRIAGQAVFLTGRPDRIPQALVKNLHHNRILHRDIVIVHFTTENVPRVPNFEKISVDRLFAGCHRIIARRGFLESPDIGVILALAREQGVDVQPQSASFFLGREKLIFGSNSVLPRWQASLFVSMSKNAQDASSFFDVPSDQVVELGIQLEV